MSTVLDGYNTSVDIDASLIQRLQARWQPQEMSSHEKKYDMNMI